MPTDSITELASQLQAFISIKHPFVSDLDPAILQAIESYAPLSTLSPASIPQERQSRSNAQPLKSSPYPVEWAESRTRLRSAVWQLQKLLKHQIASGSTGAAPEAFQSYTDFPTDPINSIITEESPPLISTVQAPETHQTVSQETTTMSGSPDSPTGQGTSHHSADDRQDPHQEIRQDLRQEIRQEFMQMMLDIFDQRDRQRQLSQGLTNPMDPTGRIGSTVGITSSWAYSAYE
jgi:hypothetical protein